MYSGVTPRFGRDGFSVASRVGRLLLFSYDEHKSGWSAQCTTHVERHISNSGSIMFPTRLQEPDATGGEMPVPQMTAARMSASNPSASSL